MKSPRRLDNRTMCVKIIATLVPARAKHQARLNALPSAAESQQKLTFSCQREQSIKLA